MSKPYIAIVDDDSAFASYLRTFLSLRGYEARCYTRGDELLAAMKQTEAPDAVLLDVMMPGLDGMATLRALKATRPEAQVIMLSGRNQASTIVEAVRAGATDYVVKPDDPEGLGEIALDVAIKNAIEKTRLVSELSELRQQLKSVNETQAKLHDATGSLVSALKAPAVRGRWGEMQLRRVVELAGMLDHCDFDEQTTLAGVDGRLRPDMIVHLPGGRRIVVDAKTPLGAYLEAREAPDDQTRVFEEFVQLKQTSDVQGTGLGLPISRRLAELLGGSLNVTSVVGEGSRFALRLPPRPPEAVTLSERELSAGAHEPVG